MSEASDSINNFIQEMIVFADALKAAKTDDSQTEENEAKMTVSEGLALAQNAIDVIASFGAMTRVMKDDPEAFAEALRSLQVGESGETTETPF